MSELVLEELRDHLVTAGIVRDPDVAGALPPMWLSPRLGLNAPNEGSTATHRSSLVLGAYVAPGIATQPKEGFLRIEAVDLRYRCMTVPPILRLDMQIRREIHDRVDWQMGDLKVSQCLEFGKLGPVGEDEQGFQFRAQYLFWAPDPQWSALRGYG